MKAHLEKLTKTPEEFEKQFKDAGLVERMHSYMKRRYLELLVSLVLSMPSLIAIVLFLYESLRAVFTGDSQARAVLVQHNGKIVLATSVLLVLFSVAYWAYMLLYEYESVDRKAVFWRHRFIETRVEIENEFLEKERVPYYWEQNREGASIKPIPILNGSKEKSE